MESKTALIFNLLLEYRGAAAYADAPEGARRAVDKVLYAISLQKALDPADLSAIKEHVRCSSSGDGAHPIISAIEDYEGGFRV